MAADPSNLGQTQLVPSAFGRAVFPRRKTAYSEISGAASPPPNRHIQQVISAPLPEYRLGAAQPAQPEVLEQRDNRRRIGKTGHRPLTSGG